MSTIASPREPSTPVPRRINSQQTLDTPGSERPSLDIPRSANSSPNPNAGPNAAFPPVNKRNRAALREYYNLRAKASTPAVEVTEDDGPLENSEVPVSELDREGFDAEAFVKKALAQNGMEDLLRLYTKIIGETRALDAEKKALVYDNYSKLITATETIRKMRANMDPLTPMASTLDPAIAQIYSQASSIRDALRKSIPPPDASKAAAEEAAKRKLRMKQLVTEVLDTPDRIRALVSEGRLEDARQAWKKPRKLLLMWKEQEIGGDDVDACLHDGDAALKGESTGFSWRDTESDVEE